MGKMKDISIMEQERTYMDEIYAVNMARKDYKIESLQKELKSTTDELFEAVEENKRLMIDPKIRDYANRDMLYRRILPLCFGFIATYLIAIFFLTHYFVKVKINNDSEIKADTKRIADSIYVYTIGKNP